ncbi:MAG: hypothetical protein VB118_11355 [Oscillospiraceae bacterium]|nr:hypothetical protein [Oscillospiraceae bacterium]
MDILIKTPMKTDESTRWKLNNDGSICWNVSEDKNIPHEDHIEMSGKFVSTIVYYGVDGNGNLTLTRSVVYPMLRTIPNNTHASLIQKYGMDTASHIIINGESISDEKPYHIVFNGVLTIKSHTKQNIDIIRTVFPTTGHQAVMDRIILKNSSEKSASIDIMPLNDVKTARGVYGIYILEVNHNAPLRTELKPGEEIAFGITYSGRKIMNGVPVLDADDELNKRLSLVKNISQSLIFECPDPVLANAFNMAKLRASESIFETKGGLMHGPGGGSYYAAVWANDQAEYAGPFFPFLGYKEGNIASLNCYRLYIPFMGPDYTPIPSSIIAEGIDIWEGAGDRGDAAMYAYGASRFALETGDKAIAEELWPAIEWCLEYCKRKMTDDGVISSKSDELEGRFPSGNANLSTSSLTYGGLRSASYLAYAIGKTQEADEYNTRADELAVSIEKYFGANVEGFDTYRYYDGNDILRAWICLPLTMGIMNRKKGTIDALFSPRLWTENGLATQAGDKTFWDRSTLYGLRGVFNAGETERALDYFTYYSRRRLLEEHVPYAVEAYPEADERQLSAESALYCRVVTEGIFGINPTGLDSFACVPRLPDEWERMSLKSVKLFGKSFDIIVERSGKEHMISVSCAGNNRQYKYMPGEVVQVKL